jgi:hypothetical protein
MTSSSVSHKFQAKGEHCPVKSTAPTISSSRLYMTTPSVVAAAQQRPVGDNATQLVRASARFLLGAPGTFISAAASSMGCRQAGRVGQGVLVTELAGDGLPFTVGTVITV